MNNEIQELIDNFLTVNHLQIEAMERFHEYFDDDDMEGAEEYLDVIIRYESEEIPYDIISEMGKMLMEDFGIEPYCGNQLSEEKNKEITNYIKEKIRVVFPFYGKYHDMEQERLKRQKDLFDNWDKKLQ